MNCGVRFCGGCNPRYDRGAAYKRIKEEVNNIDFFIAEDGKTYDYLLVIGGCTSCCAAYSQFMARNQVLKIWDESQVDTIIARFNTLSDEGRTENELERNL